MYNPPMRIFIASMWLLITLAACGESTETPTNIAPAIPYLTATSSQTPTIIPALPGIIMPTPTTFIYVVVQGDTLNGIAARFGITLETLLSANPGLQPATLQVGTKLVIPALNSTPGVSAVTPAPLLVTQARCWMENDGGLWCFALMQNELGETMENISSRFSLLDSNGKDITSQSAFALLNTLPPGKSMPLAVHFPPPLQSTGSIRVDILTAIPLLPGDARYLPVNLEDTLVKVDVAGRTAQCSGKVILTGSGAIKSLWVLATAYDGAGNVVGVRRWESPMGLAGESSVSFDLEVYSVGPAIDHVDFLAEAIP